MGGGEAPQGADRDGRKAGSPAELPLAAWRQVIVRTWKEASADNLGVIAAGVSFYAFLALAPLLAATVLTYGPVADINTVQDHAARIVALLPSGAGDLIAEQLVAIVESSSAKKGAAILLALGIALFGARNAAGAVITALNIAYEEEEQRGFLRVNLLALGMTAAAAVGAACAIAGVSALGFMHPALPDASPIAVGLSRVVTYGALAFVAATSAALLYRFGPSRRNARWRWLTPGSLLFALGWVVLTIGFAFYVREFGSYGATYGSLSAVVVLLTWLYLSAYALLFGAELNAELEHQTARDTTSGPEQPLGERGAWAADHVAAPPGPKAAASP